MDDRVIACAARFTHLTMDHAAIEILKRDFAGLLGDPAGRQPGRPSHQPLDQAELEATPGGRHKADAALDYQREQSRRIPRWLYALPGARASGESLAVELSSVAAAMAVRRVAARTRTSRPSIVLAAICAVVARRANYPELVFPLVSSNRFERHLVNYVGCLAQGSIAAVEVGGRSFDELAGHTWTTVMEASRHGRFDAVKRDAMGELIEHQRGLRFNYDPMFNSLVPESWSGLTAGVGFQPEEIDVALARTELRWRPLPFSATRIRFTLSQIDGCLRLDLWSADAGLVPRAELESVLLAVERLLVAAAHGDVPGRRMPEIIGLEPLAGPDRILADSCWVDVADVQRLVEEAVAPAVAHVFASAAGRPLVAYLTATDAVRTPEQAHTRCMAALAHHPTAITPRHYVICRTAPAAPADPAAWPAPLATGTGRTLTRKAMLSLRANGHPGAEGLEPGAWCRSAHRSSVSSSPPASWRRLSLDWGGSWPRRYRPGGWRWIRPLFPGLLLLDSAHPSMPRLISGLDERRGSCKSQPGVVVCARNQAAAVHRVRCTPGQPLHSPDRVD
jgi:hypothetical protein